MISGKELFAEISNAQVAEDTEVVGYFVRNIRMELLENLLTNPPAASAPEGWKLVPLEPYWSMIDAAIKHHEGEAFLPVSLYKAMIAAAPSPGGKK